MTTLAPAARHAVACAFCFSGSLRALVMDAFTPAFANAALNAGASNCTQRTDDFVSGRRTQTSMLALLRFVLAVAAGTRNTARPRTTTAVRPIAVDLRKSLFKISLSFLLTGARLERLNARG